MSSISIPLICEDYNTDIVLKGTQVKGVYYSDLNKNKHSILYSKLNYQDILDKELKIMDLTAFILARDHNLLICVLTLIIVVLYNVL